MRLGRFYCKVEAKGAKARLMGTVVCDDTHGSES
jgi:hypothetical protein